MKRKVWLSLVLGSSVVCGSYAASSIEKPNALDEALISVTASDLHGLIDGVGSVVEKVQPMFNGMMLKQALGNNLGDPQLEGFAAGKGLAVVMLTESNYFAVAEIAEAQLAGYTNVLSSMGMQMQVADDLLVLAMDPVSLKQGVELADEVEKKLLGKRSPSLRVAGKPSAALVKWQAEIDQMMFMLPMMVGSQLQAQDGATPESSMATAKILEAEVRVLLSLVKQVESYELDIQPKDGDIQFVEVVDAVEGSNLKTLFNAPAGNKFNKKLRAGLLGEGAIGFDYNMDNSSAIMDFVEAEAKKLSAVMSFDEKPLNGYLSMCRSWMDVMGGTICESILNGADGKFGVDCLVEVKDEAKALEMLKNLQSDWEKTGMDKLYEGLGMPMKFEFAESVRKHKDIPIHQIKVTMDTSKMAEEQKKAITAMMGESFGMDVALSKGVMVYAMEQGKMEAVLDRLLTTDAATVAPLAARKVLPEGGFYYMDFDVGRYIGFIAQLVKDEAPEFAQMAAMFDGMEPVVLAGYWNNGLVQQRSKIPGDLITRIAQAVMMAQMQQGGATY